MKKIEEDMEQEKRIERKKKKEKIISESKIVILIYKKKISNSVSTPHICPFKKIYLQNCPNP